ncbi:hypothetical protein AAE478_008437 [Parahypoxylon ruwenzoriense]
MVELKPYRGDYYLWKYLPSVAAAVVFAILFTTITGLHCYRLFKTKLWFCLPFIIGGIMEIIGYGARAAASSRTDELLPYIIQSVLILLPPVLFAASIYMVLGRIIRAVRGEDYSIIRVKLLTTTFVLGDVASFCVQGGGAGLLVQSSSAKLGENIVVGGLIIQIVMFGLFVITAVLFQYRYQRYKVAAPAYDGTGWKGSMNMLYAVSGLIMVRSIFRVVEFIAGQDSYLFSHEWPAYVFDAVLMWLVMVIFFLWYPDNLVHIQNLERMDSEGTEVQLSEQPWGRPNDSSDGRFADSSYPMQK